MQTTKIKLVLTEESIPVPNTGFFTGLTGEMDGTSSMFTVALAALMVFAVIVGMLVHLMRKKGVFGKHKKLLYSSFLFGFLIGVLGCPIANNVLAENAPSVDVPEEVIIEENTGEDVFVSKKISVVKPMATLIGYNLYYSASDGYEDLAFIPENTENETTISSITNEGSLAEDTYGFTLQADAEANDNVWRPLSDLPTVLKSYNDTTGANNTTDVYFGVLIDDGALADTYELDVDFNAVDIPLTNLTGTKWRFNDELVFDEEFLYNIDFYSKFTVADIAKNNFDIDNVTTWTQFAEVLPEVFSSFGAVNVSSDLSVQDDNGNLLIMHFGRINYYPMWGHDKLFYSFYDVSDDCLPLSTGTISYTFDEDTYRESLVGLITSMSNGAAFGEPYTSGFNIFSGQQTITITGGEDVANQEFIAWLAQNATLLERDVDDSVVIDDYIGSTWYFRETLDLDPLRNNGNYTSYDDVEFYVKMTVSDLLYLMFNDDFGIKTWSELVPLFPEYLESLGATDISSNITVTDEMDNYIMINYTGFDVSSNDSGDMIWYSTGGNYDWYSHLPATTGTVSFIYNEEEYNLTFEEYLYGLGPSSSLTENYWYGAWNEPFFRTVTITSTSGSSEANANWLKENAYLVHLAD